MHALQGLSPAALVEHFPVLTLTEARRIVASVVRDGDRLLREPIPQVRRLALEALRAGAHLPTLPLLAERQSPIDAFLKILLDAGAGERIEAVRIPLEKPGRYSVCVSSQVGCALACAFCATGRMGLRRNLETWEIVEQVRLVRAGLPPGARVHGVVFQGMGEPLANLDRVLAAIAVLTEPAALAIDARAITVCTSGLPAGIRRLAREAPRVRLGLSIASARPDRRHHLMPIDRAHPLPEVLDAVVDHTLATRLAPMFALTLLHGHNDAPEDAHALADLIHRFRERTGKTPRLSLIPYNPIADHDDPFARAPEPAETAFRDHLRARGIPTHRRYSGGGDLAAACGQLAARG